MTTKTKTIDIPHNFRIFAGNWYNGSASILYAITSTGALSLGNRSPSGCRNDVEWMRGLLVQLAAELDSLASVPMDESDAKTLAEFRAFVAFQLDSGEFAEFQLDEFTRHYLAAALWSSTDDSGEPLDANYSIGDLAPETLHAAIADCARFQLMNVCDLEAVADLATAGHDFWLTRCGHGAGFWDGDYPQEIGERLTQASQRFGELSPVVGDDGKIYFE